MPFFLSCPLSLFLSFFPVALSRCLSCVSVSSSACSSVSLTNSVHLSLSLSLCFSVSLPLCICLSVSVFLFLSVSLSLSLPLSVTLSVCHSVCLSISLTLSLSISLFLSVSLSPLLSLFLNFCLFGYSIKSCRCKSMTENFYEQLLQRMSHIFVWTSSELRPKMTPKSIKNRSKIDQESTRGPSKIGFKKNSKKWTILDLVLAPKII